MARTILYQVRSPPTSPTFHFEHLHLTDTIHFAYRLIFLFIIVGKRKKKTEQKPVSWFSIPHIFIQRCLILMLFNTKLHGQFGARPASYFCGFFKFNLVLEENLFLIFLPFLELEFFKRDPLQDFLPDPLVHAFLFEQREWLYCHLFPLQHKVFCNILCNFGLDLSLFFI